jgi:hypothetical protein
MPDRKRFELEIERVRLLAMAAIERLGEPRAALDRMEREHAGVQRAIAELGGCRADRLFDRLELGADERDLVWTAVAANDPHVSPHLLVLGGSDAKRGLTLAAHVLVARLDRPRACALGLALHGANPLFRRHLLTSVGDGTAAIRALAVPPRVIGYLAGEDEPDEALHGAGGVVALPDERPIDARQQAALDRIRGALGSYEPPLLVIEGPIGAGRRTAVAAIARELGRDVVTLDLRRLDDLETTLEPALIALLREAFLREAVPLVADLDELSGTDQATHFRIVTRMLDEAPGAAAVTALQVGLELPTRRSVLRVSYPAPDVPTRRRLWQLRLGSETTADREIDACATRYRLGAGGIARAIGSARLLAGDAPPSGPQLVQGLRMTIAEQLGDLAQRQDITQRWDELVLAPDILDQVEALVARVRHSHRVLGEWGFGSKLAKGSGVAALFSGPPGTGKTMVAGLVARELDLELYQVDLSKVVSKWVGETEKQLSRIFDAAEAGHALLLFDEADALFARRTEVKAAVDRYANLEVNYLLQRIESFGGVVILTTNLDASIDPALRRRLAGHVVFWPPDAAERTRLWTKMLDSRAPMAADVDCAALAERYSEMTGANIRNAALAAAFTAASKNVPIGQLLLERAARGEYTSMGRVLGNVASRQAR